MKRGLLILVLSFLPWVGLLGFDLGTLGGDGLLTYLELEDEVAIKSFNDLATLKFASAAFCAQSGYGALLLFAVVIGWKRQISTNTYFAQSRRLSRYERRDTRWCGPADGRSVETRALEAEPSGANFDQASSAG